MQAAAQSGVPEQPHDLVEQPFLALQPVHRGVAELFVHRVEVEIDRLALADNLAQQILEVVPERIVEVGGQLMGGPVLINNVAHLAIDRPGRRKSSSSRAYECSISSACSSRNC